jgi:tetratricopeptide (TPR) repeat protein
MPDDEESIRRLITLLAGIGDRAGALRVYRDLAQRLEREYEAAPAPATQALIEQVRGSGLEPGYAAAPTSWRELQRQEPIQSRDPYSASGSEIEIESVARSTPTIAVLPFAFRGQPEFEYLSEGVADLLGLALGGTSYLDCIEPRTLLNWLSRNSPALQDTELFHAVGERFGVDLCVVGGIVQVGGRLRASAAIYDLAQPEEPRVQLTAEASVEEVFNLADRLATEIFVHGFGAPVGPLTRIAALTTDSLPALKSYLNGEQDFRAGRYTPAVEAFQRAVLEDPHFALAHYRMAVLAEWAGIIPLAESAAVRALQDAHRLPVNDRRLLMALHAYFEGDISTADVLYREVLAIYPDSVEAWAQLAKLKYYLNSLRGRRFIEAREPLERARALEPDNIITLVHLANMAVKEGRLNDVDELTRAVLQQLRQGDYTDYPLIVKVLRAFTLEDSKEKARLWTELEGGNEFTLFWSFNILTILLEDLESATRLAELMTHSSRPRHVQLFGRLMLAELEVARGRWSRARLEPDAAARLDQRVAAVYRAFLGTLGFQDLGHDGLRDLLESLYSSPSSRVESEVESTHWFTAHDSILEASRIHLLGLLHAKLGEPEQAESCALELESIKGRYSAVTHARDAACGIRAVLALQRDGDAATALSWLERCQLAAPMHAYIPSPLYGRLHERYLLAELLAELGRTSEAENWYAALGEDSPHGFRYLAPSHLRRAELLDDRGDHEAARAHYAHFVQIWRGADPELQPLVVAAADRLKNPTRKTPVGRQTAAGRIAKPPRLGLVPSR